MHKFIVDIGFRTTPAFAALVGSPKHFASIAVCANDADDAAIKVVGMVDKFATDITHIVVKAV